MLDAIPLLALAVILGASLLRGEAIRRKSGDRAWAFSEARGKQRAAGLAFVLAIVVLAVASVQAAMHGGAGYPLLGALVAAGGGAIVVVAQIQMGRAWRVGVRAGDAPLFVSHGLFQFSRNPIFLGMILAGFGIALTAGTWWGWVAFAGFVIACAVQVGIEEAHLETSFGETYRDYTRRVPRWAGLAR